ncbi:LAME_0B07228g1_1 [Lachancea meyersii CBS 8951]|uniref:LAME_0B07228g1_1 n=1 Tax=Lachancea meyersii CBS 8951 TaxID=1266667 RepID=A0A1G4IWK1_9SACH|nr:LAME_0B07228g1_1 [Lachancea meyersii CBS 8951]
MLFKQWNDYSEPRHHIDAPLDNNEDLGSLQLEPLPDVELVGGLDISSYKKVILTTKVFRSLFPGNLAHASEVSKFRVSWKTKSSEHALYREDFQLREDSLRKSDAKVLEIPVLQINPETLVISVAEDFLHVPPIALNLLSKQIAQLFSTPLEILVLGASDRIEQVKTVSYPSDEAKNGLCVLVPPEFLTNFIASAMTQLILQKIPFRGYIAPSEGPSGYEKLSLDAMDTLIDQCWSELASGDRDTYFKECHRNWRLNGTAMGAQAGLYL